MVKVAPAPPPATADAVAAVPAADETAGDDDGAWQLASLLASADAAAPLAEAIAKEFAAGGSELRAARTIGALDEAEGKKALLAALEKHGALDAIVERAWPAFKKLASDEGLTVGERQEANDNANHNVGKPAEKKVTDKKQ